MKGVVILYTLLFVYSLSFSGDAASDYNSINKKDAGEPTSGNNNGNNGGGVGLFPSVFNLATRATISVNATCGESGPEVYCKLVEHVQMRAPQCGVCDANAPDHDKRHPISHAIDGTTRWWQSPSLQNGPQYEWVTITLDLKQVYQVAYVIVKSAISPRPANWILERSLDGSMYRAWQYYAQSDDECWARYGIQPTRGKPSYKSDTDVICTSYYSKLNPLEGGEIHTSLVIGRPGANESSAVLREFTLARYVRLRLQKIRTLNAEFMSLSPGLDDASVTRRLFYSIKDISIGGQCVCSGHASKCSQNGKFGRPQCECQHNTCGPNCDHCCPLYNQLPWRAGTPSDGAQCEPCQCYGHATSCRYDPAVAAAHLSRDVYGEYRGGGVCINCTAHTTGINCETCEDGWYRPTGISLLDPAPCRLCNCKNKPGATGRCAQVDDPSGKVPGTCECRPGFDGPQCETCAPGFRGYPNCEPCPCDIRGIDLMNNCETSCTCKENVEGERCDRCKPGFFALDKDNSDGCMRCYCSGVSTTCRASTDLHLETFSTLSGWLVSDLSVSRTVLPTLDTDTNELSVGNYELPGVESYFWMAPDRYRGNQLASYGSTVRFSVSWVVMRGDTSGRPTVGPNMILVGSNGLRLGTGDDLYKSPNITLTIQLHEDVWYHIPEDLKDIIGHKYRGEPASRDDLMSVLTHVKYLLLRAKFHTDQVEGSLWDASLQTAAVGGKGSVAHNVEHCDCPPGYTGLSCESCGYGYVHVGPSPGQGECRKCDCNGHASTCDHITGKCAPCEHNTNGTECENCIVGYYGDATRGTPSDCQRCACPLLEPSNNFSPNCELESPDGYICTDCPQGYDGDHCERCSSGFYGSPLEPESTCKRCECGGGPCDERTGQCLRCRGNTEGWRCERCLPNHYGDPEQADCKSCDCSVVGSEQTDWCDTKTGQCKCRERFTGRVCDTCESGFGNMSAGCVPCSCHPVGSMSEECDPVTGQCKCLPGVGGRTCSSCEKHHFGFSSSGCESCGCHITGSEGPACDIVTGQCPCRVHVTGRSCDSCQDGFWGLNTSRGCVPCECDRVGSVSSYCDHRTGQCHCRPGVGGPNCDQCRPGFFGFSAAGCSECERCDKLGHICDPDTGRCVCPPFTTGPSCDHCQPGAWGFEPGKGCKPCGCGASGSLRLQCDAHTGHCACREGFQGDRCSTCSPGYYGYPRCQRCDCNLAGTNEAQCDAAKGYCFCDDSGQCPCKANVVGKKCNRCKPGTFGLQPDNPDGCTQCFCFGRTTACTQAGLTVSQIMMAPAVRTLVVEYDSNTPQFRPGANIYPVNIQQVCYVNVAMPGTGEVTLEGSDGQLNMTNNLRVIPSDAGDVRLGVTYPFDSPVYWKLPKQFLGDRVLSYGGYLRFKVETEGGQTLLPANVLASYPLVQLQGNGRLILEHYPLITSPTGHYQIRLHESLWRQRNPVVPSTGGKVTREMLMVALQNVQHILIRASDSVDFTRAVLLDVSLDTGILAPGRPPPLARGVELCDCPPQYNSSSCQDPSIGFYRWYDNSSISSTIVIQLVGEARPCQCNQRSRVCDIETGYCLNCEDNTGGPHCERCGEGYYGDPAKGPCKPCPCPTIERNFARSCRVSPKGHVSCQCREGYTGKRCDRCSYGWFGFPQLEGGSCKPCHCNSHGSVSDECHEQSGQCNCRPGIVGRDCSQCSTDRFVLTHHGCTSCDDGCTGVLLDDLALLGRQLNERAGHLFGGVVPPPWPQLQATNTTARELQEWLDLAQRVAMIPDDISDKLRWQAQQLLDKSRRVEGRCRQTAKDANMVREEADKLNKEILALRQEISDVVSRLENYGQAGPAGIVSVGQALREARRLLHKVKGRNFHARSKAANQALKFCTDLLNRIKTMLHGLIVLDGVQERLSNLDDRLNDLNNIISKTIEKRNKAIEISSRNERGVKTVQSNLKRIHTLESEQRALYAEGENFNKEGQQLLNLSRNNLKNFRALEKNLTELTLALEKKEGILDRLNPLYREKYVLRAQMHADMLYNRSQQYRDLFNATQRDAGFALRASKAYQDIVDALEGAREAAVNASNAADVAYRKAHPGAGQDSLVDQARAVLAESTKLLNDAKQKTDDIEKLKLRLKEQQEKIMDVRETLTKAAQADNDISRRQQKLNNRETHSSMQNVLEKAQKISDSMDKILKRVDTINNSVKNDMRPRLEELNSDLQVNAILNHITSSRENVQKSEDLLSQLSEEAVERNRNFQKWNDTMAARLQALRNKITQARHAANGIQLSITSRANASEGCVRSFHPSSLEPSTTTSLAFDYALNRGIKQKDALILYLPSSNTDDFIAVELVAQHIRFVWDIGGGAGEVEHPLRLEPGQSKDEKNWYHVQIDRTSNIAKLAVRPHILPSGSPLATGTPVKNASKAGFGRLDVGPGDVLWVGGLPPLSTPGPPLLKTKHTGLSGCLQSVILDGHALGLWNFATQSTEGCTACVQSGEQTKDEFAFRFNGEGYAVLHRPSSGPYNKYVFSVALKFRTLDENALLFLAVNSNNSDRYVALMLRNGHVIFRVGYGGQSRLEMVSLDRHNTGNWTIVEASRLFDRRKKLEKGVLKVEGEARDGAPTPPPGQDALPDLSDASYFVGGVPPGSLGTSASRLDLPGSFLGCLAEIQIVQDGYSPLRGQFYGVEAGCVDSALDQASFHGRGHLQLPSYTLDRRNGSFGFVFRTLQSNALLMLTAFREGETSQGSYSASLVGGRLDVRVDAGRGGVVLTPQGHFNDGKFHSLAVTKTGRRLELRIDDELQDTATLPKGATVVRAPGPSGGLYFGGVPPNFTTIGIAASAVPLIGNIKDAIFNDQLIQMDHPISFEHVGIGRLDSLSTMGSRSTDGPSPSILPQPREGGGGNGPPEACHKGPTYSLEPGAAKFGDSPHSHVQIRQRTSVLQAGDFTVELDFRTLYPNGLLFILPGGKGKQLHYMLLQLRNKRLHLLIVKGRPKLELEEPQDLNDGLWHRVVLSREGNKIMMMVDSSKPRRRKRYPKKLNFGNTMYVGGIPESGLLLPESLLLKLEGFKGCLRGLAINQQSQNLSGHKVGQCFPLVEQGSYFPGDAYAVYKEKFHVGSLLELQLEFRTSENTGVLLSVSEPKGYPALSLEVNDGKVVMTGDMGDNRPFRVEQKFPSRFTVCDNRWHRIKAFFVNDVLNLRVDHLATVYGHSGNGQLTEASTNSPLYIGGLPEGAPSGTLGTRDNFKGCIRNVIIGGELKDWTDMASLNNILLSSCPVNS